MSDVREILFRGKRLDNGKWVYGSLLSFSCGKKVILPSNAKVFMQQGTTTICCNECYDVVPETIGQFTGLTDKNGVKIFEGDILKTGTDCYFVVKWDENNGRFLGFTFERERRIVYVGREPKAEIIGNIYDNNPELLKEEMGSEESHSDRL